MTSSLILKRTDSDNPDFIALVRLLDADLHKRDGEEHSFYAQFNSISTIKHALVAYHNEEPVGCGAIKLFDEKSMEVKRMFVVPEFRGKGVASQILKGLETWARELHVQKCVLETGKRQPEAIALYTKSGYNIIPNFGQYAHVENSVCFSKNLM
jgi:GNAT superfamily N-acetyltransferase